MIHVRCLPVGDLQANAYILSDADRNALIIDPGDGADLLLETIQRENVKLLALLATHGHFDHIMGVGEIQASFPVPLYVDEKDQFLIDRMAETAEHFLGYKPAIIPPSAIEQFSNATMSIGPFVFDVLQTPGHTPGSRSFYFKDKKMIFTGDTLFVDGIGSTDHGYSNKEDLLESVHTLRALPKGTVYYPGHGEWATL